MTTYSIPYVTTRTSQGERTVDIYSRLLAERVIYLGTAIDDGVANAIIAQLIHLESAMQYIRCDVETTCVGQAAATAAMLLAGGAPGKRQILSHSRVVIHTPATEGRGTIPDLVLEADEVERIRTMLEEIFADTPAAHRRRSARIPSAT